MLGCAARVPRRVRLVFVSHAWPLARGVDSCNSRASAVLSHTLAAAASLCLFALVPAHRQLIECAVPVSHEVCRSFSFRRFRSWYGQRHWDKDILLSFPGQRIIIQRDSRSLSGKGNARRARPGRVA